MKKLYDAVGVIGEYQSNGVTKKRYKTVGALMQNDNGMFLFIDPTVNFAAFPRKEGSDSVLIGLFEPKDKQPTQTQPTQHEKAKANAYQPEQTDDIPFD